MLDKFLILDNYVYKGEIKMILRQIFVKIFRILLPKKWRQYLKANFDFFDLNVYKAYTKVYGTIYLPIYNSHRKIDGTEPEIYNSE